MKNPWDERYSSNEFFYGREPNTFLRDHSDRFKPGQKILCLAEGEGRNAVYLAKIGCKVTAVDSSQTGLNKLAQLAEAAGVEVEAVCADLAQYNFLPNHWDGIISIWCHLPAELRLEVHKKVLSGLKPGGVYLLEAYTPDQLKFKTGGPQDPNLMPTQSQLELELSGLVPTWSKEMIRNIDEGIGHQGLSAVVQYIGKKEAD